MDLGLFVDGMIERANNSIRAVEGDYYNDEGLLMCGKCNTPKQTRFELFGVIKEPMCLCRCEVERREREEAERKRIEFERQVMRMRKEAFPEVAMQSWTFANDDLSNEQLTRAMQRYVENFAELRQKGKGLLLWGNIGTGKTFAACEVANALIDKGYPV